MVVFVFFCFFAFLLLVFNEWLTEFLADAKYIKTNWEFIGEAYDH